MAQIFKPWANSIARIVLVLLVLSVVLWAVLGYALLRSEYVTNLGEAPAQPVPFSHEHHVRGLGLDCRYCHDSVEESAFAGIPSTHTCMTCHSQIWTDADMLAPVRESLRTDTPLRWTRVHNVADFVYFNHSIHVAKGVGCVTCHRRVDKMPITRRGSTLHMRFCLDCHRNPERYIRPKEHVFDMDWRPQEDRIALGRRLVAAYNIEPQRLTDCYICHR